MKVQIKKIIRGYSDKHETQLFINKYIEGCELEYIFKDKGIEKPTYEEILKYQETITSSFRLSKEAILTDVEMWLGGELSNTQEIAEIITAILNKSYTQGLSETILKNIYIRILIAIKSKFLDLIKNRGNLLYLRKPDKYEFLILTVLGELGVNILIMDTDNSEEIEYLCTNIFEVQQGPIQETLDYKKIEIKRKQLNSMNNVVNKWFNFNNCKTYEDYLAVLNTEIPHRREGDNWKTLNLEIAGVPDKEDTYPILVNSVIQKAKALGRKYVIFEDGIYNPKFEENQAFDSSFNLKTITPFDILGPYPIFNKSSMQVEVNNYIEELIEKRQFIVENQKENYIKVLYIWLIRYLNMFYMDRRLDKVPLIVVWGTINQREQEFIGLLSLLPIDIVHFSPNTQDMYKELATQEIFKVKFGQTSDKFKTFPKNNTINKVETVAYRAERELDTLLYTDTEGLYRPNQFKDVESVVLKTTYDEIGILWNQEAKYRPSFETLGNLVKLGTIFAKINGVPGNNKEEYLDKTRQLITGETLIYQKFPFNTGIIDPTMSDFIRQVVYKNKIDFEKIKASKYYNYGVYSQETQELIIRKTEQLLILDWCNGEVQNLIYKVIEVVFTLPTDMVQLIHNYDFTTKIPKLIAFSGDTGICSLEDSIIIMFLKLIGFDILILAPTGYRLIEHYIKPILFNDITVGDYDFSLHDVDITSEIKQKKGIFKNFLIFRGGK